MTVAVNVGFLLLVLCPDAEGMDTMIPMQTVCCPGSRCMKVVLLGTLGQNVAMVGDVGPQPWVLLWPWQDGNIVWSKGMFCKWWWLPQVSDKGAVPIMQYAWQKCCSGQDGHCRPAD